MTTQRASRIRLIYGIAQSVSIAAAAICLMAACVSIYQQGGHPFSREVVAETFSRIAIPVYLCLGLVIGGFGLDLILPDTAAKPRAARQTALVLQRLHTKTDLNRCGEDLRSAVLAQQKSRKVHKRVSIVLIVCTTVTFLSYALNPGNFHQSQINDSMIRAMMVLLPCLGLSFGYSVYTVYHDISSMEKEIELLKQAGSEAKKPTVKEPPVPQTDKRVRIVRTAVLLVGIAFLIYGFVAGGTADVLTKAVNICTECVGLG